MTKIERIEQQIGDAERALGDLENRRVELAREAEDAPGGGPSDDFSEFVSTGSVTVAARTADQINADLTHTAAMIAAGEAQVAGLRRQVVDVKRAEQAARVAAMTMPDAVQFARDALGAVDLVAARAEIERIEQQIQALDAPRIAARDGYARASN